MNSNMTGFGEPDELTSSTGTESPEPVVPAVTEPTSIAMDTSVSDDGEAFQPVDDTPDSGAETDASGKLKRGEIVEGTIVTTSPTSITIDLNGRGEGLISKQELERMDQEMLKTLQPGAPVLVYVVNPSDHSGSIVLSINRAMEERDWQMAETYRQSQQVYESRIAGYNKGGLIVRFGRVRGFVPQSQIGDDRRRAIGNDNPEDRWGKMVNEAIAVKVMEVDRARNRLILSERAAAREARESKKENLLGNLQVGDVRVGRVISIVDFGAFVDVGGAEGLVHLTELSWKHVNHPKDLLTVGQQVKVEVISLDRDRKRIGLSMKRQEADPWDAAAVNYSIGQLVQGTVTKLTKFGAFARLVDAPEIEGLIHISELSDRRVNHPKDVVEEGDKLTLRIVKVDIENRRMGLSLKKVNSAEYLDQDWNAPKEEPAEPGIDDIVGYQAAISREESGKSTGRNKKGAKGRDRRNFDEYEEDDF